MCHCLCGPRHSVRRLPGSGQVQCTSWRNFAPFSSSTFKNIHGEQSGKRDRGGSAVGARHIVREHDTTQPVLNKDIKRAQSQTAPGVPRKRVLGVKVLLRAGARRPGEKLARSNTTVSASQCVRFVRARCFEAPVNSATPSPLPLSL